MDKENNASQLKPRTGRGQRKTISTAKASCPPDNVLKGCSMTIKKPLIRADSEPVTAHAHAFRGPDAFGFCHFFEKGGRQVAKERVPHRSSQGSTKLLGAFGGACRRPWSVNASLGGTVRFRSGHERAKSGNEARAMQTDTEIRECHALQAKRRDAHSESLYSWTCA